MGMVFMIDPAYLPAILTADPMSDEQFAELCSEHSDLNFEVTAEGDLIVMAPPYSLMGFRNSEISGQLREWARREGRGYACDSSTGYLLPNSARRSPDASWTLMSWVRALPEASRSRFWHLCPDFVIEIRSATDRTRVLTAKMEEWIANGAQLGWLIDPETETVTVYRPGREAEVLTGVETVTGEGPVAGFVLDLRAVWRPLS